MMAIPVRLFCRPARESGCRVVAAPGAACRRSCVSGVKGLVEGPKSAGRDRREGGGLGGRLRFAGLEVETASLVREHRNLLLPHLKTALRDLVHRLQTDPDAARSFESDSQLERLHDLTRSHWEVLTDARFDALYAERVKVLADAERRMGLDPRWHIAGHAVILEHFLSGLIDEFWPRSVFRNAAARRAQLAGLVTAVLRTALVDLEIAMSLRFNALRLSQQQALASLRASHVEEFRRCISALSARLADHDLSGHGVDDVPEGCTDVFAVLDEAIATLRATFSGAGEQVGMAEHHTGRIALSAAALADGASKAARDTRATASGLVDIDTRARRSAEGARAAEIAVGKARHAAQASGDVVGEAIAAMSDIEQSAERIGQIIGVIDDIAFQTNLLALNAGIEAARAGESGRGFAVVAQEVRALAQRSAEAAREIKQLVTTTKSQVDGGVQTVAKTQQAIDGIVGQVSAINEMIATIVSDTAETAAGIGQVATGISSCCAELDGLERTAVETRAMSGDLKTVILELGKTIRAFRLERRRDHSAPVAAGPVVVAETTPGDDDVFDGAFAEPMRLLAGGRAQQ
ncbi:MAG: globin-coupled sensor protein [Rhizobium sp.]|nr:globin-coupled sensor protein [Rhizobium sp.]